MTVRKTYLVIALVFYLLAILLFLWASEVFAQDTSHTPWYVYGLTTHPYGESVTVKAYCDDQFAGSAISWPGAKWDWQWYAMYIDSSLCVDGAWLRFTVNDELVDPEMEYHPGQWGWIDLYPNCYIQKCEVFLPLCLN